MSDELPEGWVRTKLNATLEPGGLFDGPFGSSLKTSDYTDSGVRVIRLENLSNLRFITDKETYISEAKYQSLLKHTVIPEDILVGSFVDGAVRVCLLPNLPTKAIAKADCFTVRTRPDIANRRFVAFQLGTVDVRDAFVEDIHGATRPRITTKQLRDCELSLAPLPEQNRIVEKVEALLEQVNRAKARLDRVPLILKRFRQAVLAAACSGELTREWRQTHTGERSAQDLVQDIWGQRERAAHRAVTLEPPAAEARTDLEGWCSTRIGDVVDCLDNIRRPINRDERSERTGDIPYFGANGQVGWIDTHLFDEDLVLVVEDETFIGRERPFSYVVRGKTWVNNHAHVLRPLGGMSADYLDSCLAFYNFVPLTSGTTGRRKLTKAALLSAPICVAPLAEQQEIVRRKIALFSLADTIERRVQAATARANKLPQAILSKAFSGELVPTEAELARLEGRTYETAEELLKRVTALGSDAPSTRKGRGTRAR